MADIEIDIDGQVLAASPNETIIQVADRAGIYIPRFCYQKHLSIAANCRMCLVEVEKSPKALPACATPVMPGMKVLTKSKKTREAQRAVMEFLLINHPLDCPICDQGGECELQDLSMGYGDACSHYDEKKRSVPDQNLGPLIATEMTRCIYCTRCVRFGDEIAGLREMGAIGRGEETEIGTYITHAIQSEVSGNIIDLCPVGALTNKPYRFTARPWELDQAPSVAPHDAMGANINVHTRYGKVMRMVSRENEAINQIWMSDRDRYSYTGLYHPERLEEPLVRIEGKWEVVDWPHALQFAAEKLRDTIAEFGADKFGALASPSATVEEFYLLQKLVRALDSPHIDHRLRELDTQDQANMGTFPGLAVSIADLEKSDAVLLIGSHLSKELPLLGLRIRQASLQGAAIAAVNPVDYQFNFKLTAKQIVAPQHMISALHEILQALEKAENHAIADIFREKKASHILLGALALHHPQAAYIRYLAQQIAVKTGATLSLITDGANTAGGWLAGAIPHRQSGGEDIFHVGLSAHEMLAKPRKAYLLLNVEPDLDCANPHLACTALKQASCVIALAMYSNPLLLEHADVILPMAAFTESAGTYVNICGEWQTVRGVAKPFGASRPAWKILRVLGNYLHLDGFDYEHAHTILAELRAKISDTNLKKPSFTKPEHEGHTAHTGSLMRIGEVPIYAVDSLVRHAKPLQEAQTLMLGATDVLRLHPETAKQRGLAQGQIVKLKQHGGEAALSLMLDERIAKEAAWVAGGISATQQLGDLFGEIHVE